MRLVMSNRLRSVVAIAFGGAVLVSLEAATVSPQSAEAFAEKVSVIRRHGDLGQRAGARRTPVTQDELNSWFAYRAKPLLPSGVMQPEVTIVGQGRLSGQAIVDLDAVAKRRATGGAFDPWALLGGRVPVKVAGILHTRDGQARLEIQTAEVSGVPVPPTLLQELVSFYSRSPERPAGVRLDETFSLPANIRQIEVGQGQAVIVQ
jgi:hypothetical protein